jgi:hypothetical protein
MESVPSFEETWIECLGDLARYRMAIEETDLRDCEVWCGTTRRPTNLLTLGESSIIWQCWPDLTWCCSCSIIPKPWCTEVGNALTYVEGCVPWEDIIVFLNTLGRSGVFEAYFEDPDFPQQMGGTGRQLPEDFVMRRLI